jgi:hypothetical protein
MISIIKALFEQEYQKPLDLHLKKGALHRQLGVKQGEKIPKAKLKIKKTDSETIRKRKQFAINAAKWRKK